MEAILFIGIQASGKSSFYTSRYFNSHIRISLDLLNTRNKQQLLLDYCFKTQSKFVIDNTNLTRDEREHIIDQAQQNKYKITGYYFRSKLSDAILRNEKRLGKERIPEIGIRGAYKKLELPSMDEGFDELFYVSLEENDFLVTNWNDEI